MITVNKFRNSYTAEQQLILYRYTIMDTGNLDEYGTLRYNLTWVLGFIFERIKFIFSISNWSILYLASKYRQRWYNIVLWRLGIKRPFVALVDGRKFKVTSDQDYYALIEYLKFRRKEFKIESLNASSISFEYRGKKLTFDFDGLHLREVFGLLQKFTGVQTWYDKLDVTNKTVLDIGANLGDTPIYFFLRGASKVIALEPVPKFYQLALNNINNNCPDSRIILLNQAAGRPRIAEIEMCPVSISSGLTEETGGYKVVVHNLDELVSEHNIKNAILKVVCVGCEIELLSNSSEDAIKAFNEILIVGIYGSRKIILKLKRCGFSTRVLEKHYYLLPIGSKRKIIFSVIFAKNNSMIVTN
ncbi:hypothetical protein B9Q06_10980 [Candidatus Marsarchaeota G2 archaeon ECH_B_2]|nr:MAG: hypothetical protein B9Q06_10980 [Candidatus Marsarchaeota G2 archaeon ECH_B_2]